jgi:Cell wall-associated hydrolases (invasion-associated proteins)
MELEAICKKLLVVLLMFVMVFTGTNNLNVNAADNEEETTQTESTKPTESNGEVDEEITTLSIEDMNIADIEDQYYTGKAIEPKVIITTNDEEELELDTDYTLEYVNNEMVGMASVTISGIGNYSGSVIKTFNILVKSVNKLTYKGVPGRVPYTGKQIKPEISVYNGGRKLDSSDVKISYGENKKIGKATIKVEANSEFYSETKTFTFYIVPKKVSISSVKTDDKKFTVRYKKVSGASGYQVAYRKKGTSKWKYQYISKKSSSKTIKGLARGKSYDVKVRAYLQVGKEKKFALFSSLKTAKIPTLRQVREKKVVAAAKSRLGCRYVYGSTGPTTFDCSGLTRWTYKKIGINLPHSSSSQRSKGKKISIKKLKVGDVVWRPGHVGLYVGNGKVIHAPHTGARVRYTKAKTFKVGLRFF